MITYEEAIDEMFCTFKTAWDSGAKSAFPATEETFEIVDVEEADEPLLNFDGSNYIEIEKEQTITEEWKTIFKKDKFTPSNFQNLAVLYWIGGSDNLYIDTNGFLVWNGLGASYATNLKLNLSSENSIELQIKSDAMRFIVNEDVEENLNVSFNKQSWDSYIVGSQGGFSFFIEGFSSGWSDGTENFKIENGKIVGDGQTPVVVNANVSDRGIANFQSNAGQVETGEVGVQNPFEQDFNLSFWFYMDEASSSERYVFMSQSDIGANQGLRIDIRSFPRIDLLFKNSDLTSFLSITTSFELSKWNFYSIERKNDKLEVRFNDEILITDRVLSGWTPQQNTKETLRFVYADENSLLFKDLTFNSTVFHPFDDRTGTTLKNTASENNEGLLSSSNPDLFWKKGVSYLPTNPLVIDPNESMFLYGLKYTGEEKAYVPEIRWQGVEEPNKLETSVFWARVSQQTVSEPQSTLRNDNGKQCYTTDGLIFVQLFCPKSESEAMTIGRKLSIIAKEAFRGHSSSNHIWFRNARVRELEPESKFYRFNIIAEYNYDEISK